MRKWFFEWFAGNYPLHLLVLTVLLVSCTVPVPASSPDDQSTLPPITQSSNSGTEQGQSLPISAQVNIGNQLIQLEVARTPQQQAIGLMYRTALADNRGMLFPVDPPRPVSFWMKHCLINLDMIFLRDGKVQAIAANVPPCKADPCPVYGPNLPVDQVLELRGGRAKELGLKVGDRLLIQNL